MMRSVDFWRGVVSLVAAIQVVDWTVGSRLPGEGALYWLVLSFPIVIGWLAFYDAIGGEFKTPPRPEPKAE